MVNKRQYTFSKEERLSWKRYIDLLFEKGQSFVAFPLRVIYLLLDEKKEIPASVLISVSKKKFKRAVDRNQIKRQAREAYRTQKHALAETLVEKEKAMLVAFLYLDKEIHPFSTMEKAMEKAMKKAINILHAKE
ncbi:MAG: ribonuclease P protein component [Tannerellaceae bacterium]|jgi:ribonuclease P protein component|nr:ribonuclease P protein component [Tannerellaceae bacterium]